MKATDVKTIHIVGQLDTGLRILHVGPMLEGSTTVQRVRALRDLGHELHCVNTEATAHANMKPSLPSRVWRRFTGPKDRADANTSILHALQTKNFDLIWIDKGLTIHVKTLQRARELQGDCKIVGFSPDDMMNPANQSRHFLNGLPYYDCFVTTKSYNVSELQALQCPKVLFMENAYDPHTHRPVTLDVGDRERLGGKVGFIGQWEPERAESLRKLALAGIPVRVWGYTWERMKNPPSELRIENQPLWGDQYARSICSFDINLCFLRKCNRDLQTTRTMEIPACGGFMLAERTEEHLRLFEEGREAAYFSNDDELLEMILYYLDHPEERLKSAAASRARCLSGGYSNKERLNSILGAICRL